MFLPKLIYAAARFACDSGPTCSDISDDNNADYIKIWDLSIPPITQSWRFVIHMA